MPIHFTVDLRAVLIGVFLLVAAAAIGVPFAISLADDGDDRSVAQAVAAGSAFTYQGYLNDGAGPANGPFDIQARLYEDPDALTQVPGTVAVTREDVQVTDGLFSVSLDFGAAAFDGQARYLELRIRPGASTSGYTLLSPLQALPATPYAVFALGAPWSGITGMPPGFADGVDDVGVGAGTYTAGAGLTLAGTTFSADPSYVQRRVTPGCAPNASIRTINEDGSVECEPDDTSVSNPAWSLTGNAGTTGANFIGTTDNVPLELRVNGARALRIQPGTIPSIIGGAQENSIPSGVVAATIAGGGSAANPNTVTDRHGTVGGGSLNTAGDGAGTFIDAVNATVAGGFANTASGLYSTIGGGNANLASGERATVGGGSQNTASGPYSTVGGGDENLASGPYATVGGGLRNLASDVATVGGGSENTASGEYSTVGGGAWNTASGYEATVSGGRTNTASGVRSTVAGGAGNTASGDYSFAAGRHANATGHGSFCWADYSGDLDPDALDFACPTDNSFSSRSTGGVRFVLDVDGSGNPTWQCTVADGDNNWSCSSDRNLKTNFADVDGRDILAKLDSVPILRWTAKDVADAPPHIGPMAQDFYAAFGLGNDDTMINSGDVGGVALAGIQGLYAMAKEQEARIAALEGRAWPPASTTDAAVGTVAPQVTIVRESVGPSSAAMWGVAGAVAFFALGLFAVAGALRRRRRQP